MIRKEVILTILATFCLTVTLFSLAPVRSSMPYDPWADVRGTDPNDPNSPDGKVDMRDIGYIATMFATAGDPTKTVKVGSYNSGTSTQNIAVPAHTSGNINITTDGYSRVTLGLTTAGANAITVNTCFMIGSFYAHMDSIDIIGSSSKPPNSIWLEPSIIPLMGKTAGYRFNVTAWINLNTPSYSWQVKCYFDPAHFMVTRSGYTGIGNSLFFTGLVTIPLTPIIDNVGGSVFCGEVLMGLIQREAGSGSLQWIEFEVKAPSTEEQLAINNGDTFVLNPDLNEIAVTKYGALASWNVASPEEYGTFRTYSVIGPILRIDCYNPNDSAVNLKIDTYLTTAP